MEQTAHVAPSMFPVRGIDLFLWCREFSVMQQVECAASHPELADFPFPSFPLNSWLPGLGGLRSFVIKKLPVLILQCAIKI